MSHLTHEVCGVDFFLSYNKCSQSVIDLIENIKIYLNNHRLTHFSNDYVEFNSDYIKEFQLQAVRSKIFMFFIDKYALECEWFLNLYIYTKEHCHSSHMPILIPIIFDDELEADLDDDQNTKFDKNLKMKLINDLTKDCIFSINMSEISTFQMFTDNLKEAIVDIIPIKDETKMTKLTPEKRFIDNKRPMNSEEEVFFKQMKVKETDLMQKFQISRVCMRYILPKLKTYVALSVPYVELNAHLTTMINVQCHLIWMDCIQINKVNYFNLIWQNNDEKYQINSLENINNANVTTETRSFQAKSPTYIIFFDLNTAQLAAINHEYSTENGWSIQLVEQYIKIPGEILEKVDSRPKTSKPSKSKTNRPQTGNSLNLATQKSYDEIFYICQYKRIISNRENSNKLQQGIIDSRFDATFKETVRYRQEVPIYLPVRSTPLLVNVNTMANKHFYFTTLYMPYAKYKPIDDYDYNEKQSDLKETSLFFIRKNLVDLEILEIYDKHSKNNWKLIDLKAYKDEKSLTKFSMIWSTRCFYEGTSRMFIGLTKNEALDKIDEMNLRGLYPKIVTGYCYSSSAGEHLYALFFCQF